MELFQTYCKLQNFETVKLLIYYIFMVYNFQVEVLEVSTTNIHSFAYGRHKIEDCWC